jgi:hypothetical protein
MTRRLAASPYRQRHVNDESYSNKCERETRTVNELGERRLIQKQKQNRGDIQNGPVVYDATSSSHS